MIQSPLRLLLFCTYIFLLQSSVFGQPLTVHYTPSTEDFANPERGFMQFTETNSTNYSPLNAVDLSFWRNLNQPFGADYAIYSTLGYRGFYLESFTNGPISNAYLDAMQQDFAAAREAGVKLVLRFAYTHKATPPYGDAPKNIVLQHIAQLKPIFLANADVIAVLNMGFIGAWGEGYYTDYFGDDSQPPYGLTTQNWNDRTEVLNALLDALPADRSVQVRIPQMKQKAVYGAMAPVNSAALSAGEAWQNTPKARTGFHNDCFLSGDDDQGTFKNYDTGVSGSDTTAFKPYSSSDSQFVPVGGETCIDWNPYSDCVEQPGGGAQHEMARMHFSYLNAGWNNAVNNDWVSGGCIEEIKQRLGYRLELQTGEYPAAGSPGQTISIKIELKNKGFAAPFNPRKVRFLMRDVLTNALWDFDLPDDPRTWLPGNQIHTIDKTITLPANMPLGNYELLLHLADPYPSLTDRPEYAIRLANENTWEAATGFNLMQHQISVECAPVLVNITTLGNPAFCTGGSVTLYATKGYANYQWQHNGTPIGGVASDSLIVTQQGVYWVSARDSLGCLGVSNFLVVAENSLPNVQIEQPSFIQTCEGESVSLNLVAGNFSNYSWYLNGQEIPGAVSDSLVVDAPGAYMAYCMDVMGCGNFSQEVTFSVNPLPTPVIEPSGSVLLSFGESVLLDGGTGYESLLWNTGETTQQITVSDCGEYSVMVVDAQGCSAMAAPVAVSVSPIATFANGILVSTPANGYQWLFNGVPIVGAINQTYVPIGSGNYTVQVDCPGVGWVGSNVVLVIIGRVSETSLGRLNIYPNPLSSFESELVLEIQDHDNQLFMIVLTDFAGREVLRKSVMDFSEKTILEIGEIPAGSYLVQAWQKEKMVATGMFLKI